MSLILISFQTTSSINYDCTYDYHTHNELIITIRLFIFRSFQENIPPDNSEISSSSEKDYFQQKFSVAVHSSEPLLLCSDGYMVTIFQFNSKPDYSQVITDLTKDVSRFLLSDPSSELEKTCGNVSVQGMSAVSPFMAKLGKDVSSSPGSTLSETATGA